MKSLPERLNDRFEQRHDPGRPGENHTNGYIAHLDDPEIDELVALARRFQAASQLQVDGAFANWLERRMLRHHLEVQEKKQTARGWWLLRSYRAHPALATLCSLCIVLLLVGTSTLVLAAQATSPNNPLYGLKQFEQHLQYSLAHSPADQAALDLQFTRERLAALASLADQAHTGAYVQALLDLNQQFTTTTRSINNVPAGTQRTQLLDGLNALVRQARQELRGFLPTLNVTESLATTTELGLLGESVPRLTAATLTLPARSDTSATISVSGSDIQPGAQLLVNGKRVQVTGTTSHNQFVFTVTWNGDQHPHSLGILNPDGTTAETLNITIINPNENDNGDDNGHGGHSGRGSGKPEVTPTPHH